MVTMLRLLRDSLPAVVGVAAVGAAFFVGRMSVMPVDDANIAQFSPSGLSEISELRVLLGQQQARLEAAQSSASQSQLVLSREIGRLQAGLDRLNALGAKLSEVALIDPELFDFSQEPPVGGPITSEVAGADWTPELAEVSTQLELRRRQLDILEHLLMVSQLQADHSPSGWPVQKGWVSSKFGLRSDPFTGRRSSHHGLDFAAPMGSDILAVAAGVVSYAGRRSGYGNVVEINHGNGYVTRYAHNRRNLVAVGDRVSRGQVIGHVGRSGRATGAHLHFEVMLDGERINPARYVVRRD